MQTNLARRAALVAVASVALAGGLAARPALGARRLVEAQLNLDVARRLATILRANGVDVRETRTTDRTVSLGDRTALARSARADAFLSVHHNAGPSGRSGTEVYRQVAGAPALAEGVAAAWRRRLPGRSVRVLARGTPGAPRRDYYFVLRTAPMPALILEGAYLTNPGDARLVADPAFRQAQAEATADGVLRWASGLGGPTPPLLDPGRRSQVAALPTPDRLRASVPDRHRVLLRWQAEAGPTAYRVYRGGKLIGEVAPPTPLGGEVAFEDVWVRPATAYGYEVRAVAVRGPVALESAPALASARTPRATIVVDAGHGGREPGALGTA